MSLGVRPHPHVGRTRAGRRSPGLARKHSVRERSALVDSHTLVLHATASQREKKDRATFRKQRLQERQKALQVAKLCDVR